MWCKDEANKRNLNAIAWAARGYLEVPSPMHLSHNMNANYDPIINILGYLFITHKDYSLDISKKNGKHCLAILLNKQNKSAYYDTNNVRIIITANDHDQHHNTIHILSYVQDGVDFSTIVVNNIDKFAIRFNTVERYVFDKAIFNRGRIIVSNIIIKLYKADIHKKYEGKMVEIDNYDRELIQL